MHFVLLLPKLFGAVVALLAAAAAASSVVDGKRLARQQIGVTAAGHRQERNLGYATEGKREFPRLFSSLAAAVLLHVMATIAWRPCCPSSADDLAALGHQSGRASTICSAG